MGALGGVPQCTLGLYQADFADRHLLHGVLAKWAAEKPGQPAIVDHDRGQVVDWITFERTATALAMRLVRLGFRQGDFLAASLPFLTEHIFLEYACFKIGVIHAPLDLRLRPAEVLRCLNQIRARGFAFLGRTPATDFRELGRAVKHACPSVERLIQLSSPQEVIDGVSPSTS